MEVTAAVKNYRVTIDGHSLGPHQVLVLEGRTLQVDDSLGPQRDVKDPPDLDVHLGRAKDHHVVVLRENTHTSVVIITT